MEVFGKFYNPDPVKGYVMATIDGVQYTVQVGNTLFIDALDAYRKGDWQAFIDSNNPSKKISHLFAKYENVEVNEGFLYVNGDKVNEIISDRLMTFLERGVDTMPIMKFISRLELNPSSRAVKELYTFLEHKMLPLTDSGTFLAYKAVNANYMDCHSNTYFNGVDCVLSMPRNKVDDNKNVGCSYGFHAGTLDYASGFMPKDGHLMLVEIDPADVVSIPVDSEFQKLRTCRYKVVAEYENALELPLYKSRFETENDEQVDDYWDDDSDSEICSECREQSCGNCSECDCCEGCCDCQEPEGGCMADWDEPRTEIQLELNLDNKIQSVDWTKQTVSVIRLVGHLFASRRPALAMSIRREFDNYDEYTQISFEILLHHTTLDDVKRIYNELNP
jgi:hypothetical protein